MLPLPTIASRVLTTTGFTFPRTVEKLEQLITDTASPEEVIRAVVESDPLLTAMILGQASQGGKGLTRLSDALRVIGLGGIIGLTRGFQPLPESSRATVSGCWQLGNACGMMLRIVVRQALLHLHHTDLKQYDDETLNAVGLVHDLGSAVAAVRFPQEYARAVRRLDGGDGPFATLLKQELGADGSDLGYILARNWNLPVPLMAGIRFHNRPAGADSHHELVAALHIARMLVRGCGHVAGPDRFIEGFDEQTMSKLNLRLDDLPPMLNRFLDEWEATEMFEVGAR